MFACLSAAVDALDIPADGGALREVVAIAGRLNAKVAEAVRAFDVGGGPQADHALTAQSWLGREARLDRREAGRLVAVGRKAHRLGIDAAATEGRLSAGQVRAICALVPKRLDEKFAAVVEDLVGLVEGESVELTVAKVKRWVELHLVDDSAPLDPREPERSLHLSRLLDERWRLDADLDADTGQAVAAALAMADGVFSPREARTPAQRRADALGEVCRTYLDNRGDRTDTARPHVTVVVDADDLHEGRRARYLDGSSIDPAAYAATVCDCELHRVMLDAAGVIVDLGRSTRTASAKQREGLLAVDGPCCRFHGCDRPAAWSDVHHVTWWRYGGRTDLDNLVFLCRRHHRQVHQPGWHAKLLPDRTFEVATPDGRVLADPPRRQPRC